MLHEADREPVPAGMVIDRDVMVRVRDGATIAVDVFRPGKPGRYPVIFAMSPYGKDVFWPDRFPLYDLVDQSPRMTWETENPDRWVPEGYVLVRADTRGSGHSPGLLRPLSRTEQEDAYDVIEWAGVQEWSNGHVGMSGISWYAMLAWLVAALRPPHLAAIVAWDGLSDFYREWAYQGGILHNTFTPYWWGKNVAPNQYGLDHLTTDELDANVIEIDGEMREHPFIDDWHRERSPAIEDIDIPVLSATAWGSLHLHLRGNVEGFLRLQDPRRRLMIFPGDHITPFYTEWGRATRKRFFDHWLSGVDNGAENDAPVRLGLRDGVETVWRDETEWPIARTRWTEWHLDASSASLQPDAPSGDASASFISPDGEVAFESAPVLERTEITGPASLRLWVRSRSQDLDVFVTVWQLDVDGAIVPAYGILGQQLPHAVGSLRASHRALDLEKSLPYRPYHSHLEAEPVPVDQPYALDIEIWPTSLVLAPGHRLRLVVSGADSWLDTSHNDPDLRSVDVIGGKVDVLTGGGFDSALLLPVVPLADTSPGH